MSDLLHAELAKRGRKWGQRQKQPEGPWPHEWAKSYGGRKPNLDQTERRMGRPRR